MTETIRCPGCSTRFALRPERVHPRIRRARCFRCGTTFEIADAVQRLFDEPPAQPILPAPAEAASTLKIPVPAEVAAEPPVPAVPEAEPEPEPEPIPAEVPAPFEPGEPPSLTLGDLEGTEDEILEKTLVIDPPPLPDLPAPEEDEAGGGFASAKDAIAKLMGDTPTQQAHAERRQLGSRGPMDVEATLSALEDTLGGNRPLPPPPEPPRPPVAASSTLKLTAEEIQAAMASIASTPGSQPPQPPVPAFQPSSFAPPVPPRIPAPQPPHPLDPPLASQGSDLLKIQMEQETLDNVSIDQLSAWIAQGRVQEYHMVARQFSDHWIEASKVPALRPAFDRLRRETGAAPEPIAPPPELPPARRSLFGGLFGRN